MDSSERTGVLVVRIWTEDGETVRARISSTTDSAPPSTAVVGSVDDIGAVLALFLETFTARQRP
jgi:hypothetical protein